MTTSKKVIRSGYHPMLDRFTEHCLKISDQGWQFMNELMEAVQEARCSQTGGRCYEAMPSAKHPQCAIAAVLQALPNSKLAKRTVARALCDAWFPKGAPFITSDMNVWYQDSQVILSALAELVKDD